VRAIVPARPPAAPRPASACATELLAAGSGRGEPTTRSRAATPPPSAGTRAGATRAPAGVYARGSQGRRWPRAPGREPLTPTSRQRGPWRSAGPGSPGQRRCSPSRCARAALRRGRAAPVPGAPSGQSGRPASARRGARWRTARSPRMRTQASALRSRVPAAAPIPGCRADEDDHGVRRDRHGEARSSITTARSTAPKLCLTNELSTATG
jgi:hypothetical protein